MTEKRIFDVSTFIINDKKHRHYIDTLKSMLKPF